MLLPANETKRISTVLISVTWRSESIVQRGKNCTKYVPNIGKTRVCVCGFFFLGFFLKKIFRVLQTRRRVEISKMSESQESNVIF